MPPHGTLRPSGRRRAFGSRVLGLVALTTVPLLVLTAFIAQRAAHDSEARVTADRVALARAAALTLSSFVDAQTAAVQALTPTPDVSDPFTRPDLPGFLRRALGSHPQWEEIDLIGPQGHNLASAHRAPDAIDVSDRPFLQQALSTGQPALSTATISPTTGGPVVYLAVPVDFVTGVRGALMVTLSTRSLGDLLAAVRKTDSVQLLVVDRTGNAFAYSGDATPELMQRRGPDIDAVLAGETGSLRATDNGVEVLSAYAPVSAAHWGVLALQPISVAFGSARHQLQVEVALLALTAAVMGIIGWYLGHRLGRSYERELDALARAEEAGRQRDQFLLSASHDLKTPLTTIKSMAQLLERRANRLALPGADWFVEALGTIDTAATRMVSQIDELLDAARIQTERPLTLERRPVDLIALVRKVVAEQEQTSERHRIRIEAHDPSLTGSWDGARIERVLGNLLGNAIKYSPNGGEITITVDRGHTATGDWALLTVRDHGIGIPAADLPHIFEPFRRAGNVVGKVGGSGIGLTGVRQIVEQHGGTIAVDSREGAGTTVRVRLPLTTPSPDLVAAAPAPSGSPNGR